MADVLSRFLPDDPQRFLSAEAIECIDRARIEAEQIVWKAEAKIDVKHLDQSGRKAAEIRNEADLARARAVLKVYAIEFAKVAPSLSIFQDWMCLEIEAASNSFELYDSQRKLLESELLHPKPDASPPGIDPLRALLKAAEDRWVNESWQNQKAFADAYKTISKATPQDGCLGRAALRVEALETFESQIVSTRLNAYLATANEAKSDEMLSPIRLYDFTHKLDAYVGQLCAEVRRLNETDCKAEHNPNVFALKAIGFQIDDARRRILTPVKNRLRIIEDDRESQKQATNTLSRKAKECTRNTAVDAFLEACNKCSKTRIRRRHLWLSVGHARPRQFEYWQACDEKATPQDEVNFKRILGTKPADFVALLTRKGLLAKAE